MKPVILIILSMLALSGYAVYAASTPVKSSSQASQTAVASKKAPSFMFVIQAKKGEIKYNKKAAQYELVLNKADVNHVIMFSDRPYRIVKYITGKNLAADWSVGSNSFKNDPPNAVLSGEGMKAEIIILSNILVKEQHIIFGLQGYTGVTGTQRNVMVVIDEGYWGVTQPKDVFKGEYRTDTTPRKDNEKNVRYQDDIGSFGGE